MTDIPGSVSNYLHSLLYTERAIAYLYIDTAETLTYIGGELAIHGIADLILQQSACAQLAFLEGLLPLCESPFLLRSVQSSPGHVADVHLLSDGDNGVWVIFIDVTAEHDQARRVQQKAYDMTLLAEREARLIHQLESANQELRRTYQALEQSQTELLLTHRRLTTELTEAANYICSILPPPLAEPVRTEWRFIPCTELGGDFFGYHFIDHDHFALYVLDVSGHGVGAALLSVTVGNTLRSKNLPDTDFHDPGKVLTALNRVYQMDKHNDLFLTIWYGVYNFSTCQLKYSSAGHPPAILMRLDGNNDIELLQTHSPLLGMMPDMIYHSQACSLPRQSRLYLLSDGAYEIQKTDGSMLDFREFLNLLVKSTAGCKSELDGVLGLIRELHGPGPLEDDLSIIKFIF